MKLIRDLQNKSFNVVFIGDSVNNTPAINVTNVGTVMGDADISKEAGNVVVLNSDLRSITFLVGLSKVVRKKTPQNIRWAFIYNATLIPVAVRMLYHHCIFITPEVAAIVMILSDVSVISNAPLMSKLNLTTTWNTLVSEVTQNDL